MTPKERFLKALKIEKPDQVPLFDFLYSPMIFKEVLGIEPKFTAKEQLAAAKILGLDSVLIPMKDIFTSTKRFITENIYIDEWGVTYKIEPVSWPINAPVEYVIRDKKDLKKYKPPDPNIAERYEEMSKVIEMNNLNNDSIALGGGVFGSLSTAWLLQGPERMLLNTYDNPNLIKEIFKISNNYWIPCGINQINAGVDYLWLGEDLGFNTSPYFSLKTFRELLYPFLEEMITELRKVKKDIPIVFHCDGNFRIFIEDLIKLGLNGIHPFQRTAGWDIGEVKEKYGKRICIIGNIDSTRTLPYCTPEEVEKEVKETIDVAAKDGGYVLASDHSLHDGIPMINIWAMINAGKKYGKVY